MTATPSTSTTPSTSSIPSSSTTPSSTSTPSMSATPSTSTTPSATQTPPPSVSSTPSTTPSISTTPSPAYALYGEDCNENMGCEPGTVCGCQGRCAKKVTYSMVAIGDDRLLPVVCGAKLQPETEKWFIGASWTYSGSCDDIYFRVYNRGGPSGMIAAVKQEGHSNWIPTKYGDPAGLNGIVTIDPEDESFFTDRNYDFSSWRPVINQQVLRPQRGYKNFIETYNADILSFGDKNVPKGFSWYKIKLPFC